MTPSIATYTSINKLHFRRTYVASKMQPILTSWAVNCEAKCLLDPKYLPEFILSVYIRINHIHPKTERPSQAVIHEAAQNSITIKMSTLKEPTEGADISYRSYQTAPEYCPVALSYAFLMKPTSTHGALQESSPRINLGSLVYT